MREWLVPGWVASVGLLRLAQALRLPEARMLRGVPDDAFYYLQTARVFAATGRWSFDGVEPASGFHLLWGYLLAAMYRVRPGIGLHAVFALTSLFGILCMAAAAWLCARTALRLFGAGAELGVGIICLSAVSLQCGALLMEAPLVILLSAAVAHLLCNDRVPQVSFLRPGLHHHPLLTGAAALLLGWLGVLARSDFGLLPLALFLAHLVQWRRGKASATMVWIAAAVLTGCALGVATVTLHTHWVSGEWVQASARQKLRWAGLVGYSSRPVWTLVQQYFNSSAVVHDWTRRGLWCARLLLLALSAGVLAGLRRRGGWALPAMLCVVAGYGFLYRYNSAALQAWYLAQFQVPMALLAAGALAAVPARRLVTAAALALCLWGSAVSLRLARTQPAPFYAAALYLRAHPELRPAGAWNAGMLGYVSGGGVTNLDGLVNDRIYPYAAGGTALDYVRARNLRSIIDFPAMVDPAAMAQDGPAQGAERNGYADGRLQRCLHLTAMAGPMAVYHVDCGP